MPPEAGWAAEGSSEGLWLSRDGAEASREEAPGGASPAPTGSSQVGLGISLFSVFLTVTVSLIVSISLFSWTIPRTGNIIGPLTLLVLILVTYSCTAFLSLIAPEIPIWGLVLSA